MSSKPIIEVINISKIYGSKKVPAIENLSFEIKENEVFGLLGPNGAGKTTTISLLCGLFHPTSGDIRINGTDLKAELNSIKQRIGIVPQDIALYPTLTGRENLEFYGAMYGVDKVTLKERIDHWLKKLDMYESADNRVDTYSGGMKRRLNLIAGILHEPEILFLDEPTVGVDVQSRAAIMQYMRALNESGMTIIYTSHHLEEAEKFCSDVAIIDKGKIIARGEPKALVEAHAECTTLEDVFLKLTNKSIETV